MNCQRCDFTAKTQDELADHAAETGHPLCIVCERRSLNTYEEQTCTTCIQRCRDSLNGILEAFPGLEPIVENAALHPGTLPGGDALVMLADGSVDALRPYKPEEYKPRDPVTYPTIPGRDRPVRYWRRDRFGTPQPKTTTLSTTHPSYVDDRPVPDGREHFADHWPKDPTVPLALLDSIARDWRTTFGHQPPDDIATLDNTVAYLLTWLPAAARTHPGFDDHAAEILTIHSRIGHTTGTVNQPKQAGVGCFDCGGDLISDYRDRAPHDPSQRLRAVADQRKAELTYGITALTSPASALTVQGDSYAGVEMVDGDLPIWTCRDCDRTYEPAEYWLAVRAVLEAQAEKAG